METDWPSSNTAATESGYDCTDAANRLYIEDDWLGIWSCDWPGGITLLDLIDMIDWSEIKLCENVLKLKEYYEIFSSSRLNRLLS